MLPALFVCFAGALLLAGCEQRASSPHAFEEADSADRPAQESWDVNFVISQVLRGEEESKPRVRVVAGYMANFEEDSTYTLLQHEKDSQAEPSIAYLFDEAGDSTATVTANRFYYFDDERRMEAHGNVRVKSREDRVLETEHLIWLDEEQELRAPGFLRMETPTELVEGYELRGDETLQTYEIARVTGQVTMEDEEDA